MELSHIYGCARAGALRGDNDGPAGALEKGGNMPSVWMRSSRRLRHGGVIPHEPIDVHARVRFTDFVSAGQAFEAR